MHVFNLAHPLLYLIEFLHQTTTLSERLPVLDVLYLIEFLHQTTTDWFIEDAPQQLYLIEFLHQTTTYWDIVRNFYGCILLNFYIKPQLLVLSVRPAHPLYLIEFLHQTTTFCGI